MAIDFNSMAKKAKAEHENRELETDNRRKKEKEERDARTHLQVIFLKSEVMPLLETAKKAFYENGVDIDIKSDLDVFNFAEPRPNVSIRMRKPAVDRNAYRSASPILFFECKKPDCLEVALSTEHGSRPEVTVGQAKAGEIDELVERAITKLAELFYKMIEDRR